MSKRSLTLTDSDDQPLQKSRSSNIKRTPLTDHMGEFEDSWEDEIEEELVAPNDPHGPSAPRLNDKERLIVIS